MVTPVPVHPCLNWNSRDVHLHNWKAKQFKGTFKYFPNKHAVLRCPVTDTQSV